jgi:hypothetical protein
MNKLYVYACSYGKFGHVCQPAKALGESYPSKIIDCPVCAQHPNITKDVWIDDYSFPQIIASTLGLDLVNRSLPGANNYKLFTFFLEDLPLMDINDTVLFQWTHINRAWYAKDPRRSVMVHTVKEFESTAEYYYEHFYDDQQSLSQLLGLVSYTKSKTPGKYYFASADSYHILNNINNMLCADLYDIEGCINPKQSSVMMDVLKNEGSSKFHCGHPTEKGHKIIATTYLKNIAALN